MNNLTRTLLSLVVASAAGLPLSSGPAAAQTRDSGPMLIAAAGDAPGSTGNAAGISNTAGTNGLNTGSHTLNGAGNRLNSTANRRRLNSNGGVINNSGSSQGATTSSPSAQDADSTDTLQESRQQGDQQMIQERKGQDSESTP